MGDNTIKDLLQELIKVSFSDRGKIASFLRNIFSKKEKQTKVREQKLEDYKPKIEAMFGTFSDKKQTVNGFKNKSSSDLMAERNERLCILNELFENQLISESEFASQVVRIRRFYLENMQKAVVSEAQTILQDPSKQPIDKEVISELSDSVLDGNVRGLLGDVALKNAKNRKMLMNASNTFAKACAILQKSNDKSLDTEVYAIRQDYRDCLDTLEIAYDLPETYVSEGKERDTEKELDFGSSKYSFESLIKSEAYEEIEEFESLDSQEKELKQEEIARNTQIVNIGNPIKVTYDLDTDTHICEMKTKEELMSDYTLGLEILQDKYPNHRQGFITSDKGLTLQIFFDDPEAQGAYTALKAITDKQIKDVEEFSKASKSIELKANMTAERIDLTKEV